MIAILPAAGRGTRMSAVTGGSKELLTIGGKAVLDWVIEEARSAGADSVVVVASPFKQDLLDYLQSRGIDSVIQEQATGLAPAVSLAASLQPTLILLPDTLFFPNSPTARIVEALNRGYDIAIAVGVVADEKVSQYGIVDIDEGSGRISKIREKPRPSETSSRWAIAARFGLSARTLMFVKQRVESLAGSEKEIDLPPLLDEAIQAGHAAIAVPLESGEVRHDCGRPESYAFACEEIVNHY
jgi:UTP--glucose-1-phosphate uridylyltransferase